MHFKIIIKNKSFTLVEILIVVSLLVGIFVIFLSSFLKISKEYFSLYNDTVKIKAILEQARESSVLGLENQSWGVYFVNSSSAYYLFSGSSFISSTNYSQFFLESSNIFSDPAQNQTKEVIFQKYSGFTTSTQIKIKSKNKPLESIIYVNRVGNIEFEILK